MAGLVLNETGMEDCGIDDSFKYDLYSVVYSVVFVLGLCTNCAALFVFCLRMKLRNETTLFMTNLALSDLVFVFTLPFKVYYNVNRHWPFGDELCKVSGTAFITNIYGSMLFLTCISVDRFLAIVYPFRSRSVRTRRNAGLVCAAVWLTIVGGGISVTFFSTINQANRATACFEGFSKSTWKTYLSKITIFIEIVGFILPLLTNLVCSSLVLRTLRRPGIIGHGCNSKRRVLRMILVHLAIFIVCFVPYNSILFLYAMVRTQALANCNLERFVRTLYPITLCLATFNCCLDPVVYYFTSESFQKSLTTGGKGGVRAESIPRSDTHLSSEAETQQDTGKLTRDGRPSRDTQDWTVPRRDSQEASLTRDTQDWTVPRRDSQEASLTRDTQDWTVPRRDSQEASLTRDTQDWTVPRRDSQEASLTRDTQDAHALASNGKDMGVNETQF